MRQRYDDALTRVSWQEFERLLAAFYAGRGYRVEHVGTGGSGDRFDGGIDLKLRRDDEYLVVQCKHWNAAQVPHNVVHELLGIMLTEGASGAIVITSGEFTAAARAAATKQACVQLIDGAVLREMLGPLVEPSPTAPGSGNFDHWNAPFPEVLSPGGSGRRYRPYRRHSGRPSNPLRILLFSVVAAVIVLLVVYNVVSAFAARTAARASAASRARVAAPAVPRPVPRPMPNEVRVYAPSIPSPPPPPVRHYDQTPMTEAELREWKRKNDEAMKILEKTTPEVPLR
ncbi:MAG TPA: restriction endonuclease [Mizugakiibacter sp.]